MSGSLSLLGKQLDCLSIYRFFSVMNPLISCQSPTEVEIEMTWPAFFLLSAFRWAGRYLEYKFGMAAIDCGVPLSLLDSPESLDSM